eukprot:jgi/Botrbrau1/21521/Bobra.174_2s0024.1
MCVEADVFSRLFGDWSGMRTPCGTCLFVRSVSNRLLGGCRPALSLIAINGNTQIATNGNTD